MVSETNTERALDNVQAQQRATSEILRVISHSPGDLDAIFDVILDHALRLSHSQLGIVYLCKEEGFKAVGLKGVPPAFQQYLRAETVYPGPQTGLGRMSKQRRIIHIHDVRDDGAYREGDPLRVATVDLGGARTFLAVPMIDRDTLTGAFSIYRQEVKSFTEDEISLLQVFSNQAAIAVANARLIDDGAKLLQTVKEQAATLEAMNVELERRVAEQVRKLDRLGQLKRFLSPEVAEMILSAGNESALASHRQKISALFCDLRNFTAFSETVEPEEAIDVLQTYHEEMGKLIAEYGGTIDHRAGDGIMVILNDPLPCEAPAKQSLALAIAMQECMRQLCDEWRRHGWELGLGVGISFGYATLGMVGDENRRDYTANGTVVNLASRLCDEAKSGQILITQRLYAETESAVRVESIGEITLKGIARKVRVWNVIDMN